MEREEISVPFISGAAASSDVIENSNGGRVAENGIPANRYSNDKMYTIRKLQKRYLQAKLCKSMDDKVVPIGGRARGGGACGEENIFVLGTFS